MSTKELWFITGSQHLYGPETLRKVADNSSEIVKGLNVSSKIPVKLKFKSVVTTADEITSLLKSANNDDDCIGVILWMHTFSPAKMWISGIQSLTKPICHLHTQFNSEIPWESIDMDFMNLNQSAHGDREFGFLMSSMRKQRKIITGHWKSDSLRHQLDIWSRVVLGWDALKNTKVARIGDNMRNVAVTEGNKVSAQQQFGFSVNGYSINDLTEFVDAAPEAAINAIIEEYETSYHLSPELVKSGVKRNALVEAARIEVGLRNFLKEGNFNAFTDTFENLGSLKQLPGISVQRLMHEGYGFGAEGDWKTAALLRAMKVMSIGLTGGTSFMEDYTYHFTSGRSLVLGAHMLEICPSIAQFKPSCEVHPLGIGGKEDPVRLVFNGSEGKAINASLIDLGNRFRLVVNEVKALEPLEKLPHLPVARVLWDPQPNLEVAATAWIMAGGAHHTVFSQALTTEFMEDFADIAGIELLVIDNETNLRTFKDTMNANEAFFNLKQSNF